MFLSRGTPPTCFPQAVFHPMTALRDVDPVVAAPSRSLPAVFRTLALAVLALAGSGVAGLGALLPDARSIPLPVEVGPGSVTVRIPAGAVSCLLEVKQPSSQRWYRWKTLLPAGKPAVEASGAAAASAGKPNEEKK